MLGGEVIRTGAGCYQWIIHDFFSLIQSGTYLSSKIFSFPDINYSMQLHYCEEDGFLKLKCFSVNSSPPSKLNVRLGMRTGQRGKIEYRSGETVDGAFEPVAWIKWSEFRKRRREILNNGCLTVFCEFRRQESASGLQEKIPSKEKITAENKASERDSDKEETDSELKTLKIMRRDFGNLLIDREDCDVTIKVQGKEFPAHRIILRVRSPVFKSMFSHEMVEKQSGVVVIEDCDPDTFPDFLNYVYTGTIKHISGENVFSLYTVSDKYDVKELKEECATFMKNNMSVGTFCDVLTLALRHTEKEMIDLATEFFCSNATEITKTAKWQTFLHENTTVGNELFIKAFSKKN